MEQSFIAFLEDSIKKNWDLDALTDYKGATLQYKDVARKIENSFKVSFSASITSGSNPSASAGAMPSPLLIVWIV